MLNVPLNYYRTLLLYTQYFKMIGKVTIEKGNLKVKTTTDENICITSTSKTLLPLMKRSFPREINWFT